MTIRETSWPSEIRLEADRRVLRIVFADGQQLRLPAELLRVESPSAEVQGHSPAEKKLVPGKREVTIVGVEPVGNYAVKLTFDDGHATGIYGWRYLTELGREPDEMLRRYRERLAEAGLSPDTREGGRASS